jgi:glycerol-3-phosphate acyltransferase PlsY
VLAALLIYTHRANLGRLRHGTESKVPLPWKK